MAFQVLVVGATSNVGCAIAQELGQGQYNKFFKVYGAVPNNESPEKRDCLKEHGCIEVLLYERTQIDLVRDYIGDRGIKAMVIAGTSEYDDSEELMAWIDAGRKSTVDFVLLLSAPGSDLGQTILAKRYQGLESYLSSNARYYTILRTAPFTDILKFYADEIRKEKTLKLPLSKVFCYFSLI